MLEIEEILSCLILFSTHVPAGIYGKLKEAVGAPTAMTQLSIRVLPHVRSTTVCPRIGKLVKGTAEKLRFSKSNITGLNCVLYSTWQLWQQIQESCMDARINGSRIPKVDNRRG